MTASASHRLLVGRSTDEPQTWRAAFFWMGMWLTGVAITTALVSSAVFFVRSSSTPQQASIDGWQWGSREQKLTQLREAFNGRRPVIVDPRRTEIESFLKELTTPPVGDETAKWFKMLDFDRFRRRVLSSPWVTSLSLIDRRALMSRTIDELTVEGPNQFHKIEIIRIVPWAQVGGKSSPADETLVFTLADRGYEDGEPVLFWLREIAGQWKLVDWEFVDGGSSESESAGIWESAIRDKLSPAYLLAQDCLRNADALPYQNQLEYEKYLRQAEECHVPAPMEDLIRYMILNRWSHRSHHEEVRRLATLVRDPERIPGILVLQAKACQRLGETDDALAFVDRLEQTIGFRPQIAKIRAELLQRSNRREEALAEWRRLVDFDPSHAWYLSELYKLLPKADRGEIIERIKAQNEPAALAAQFAQFNSNRMSSSVLQDLSQFIKNAAPDSSEARELEILCLRKDFDYLSAAALYRTAAERETDASMQQHYWGNYLREMNLAGELLAGFAQHPNPKAAFRALVYGTDDDETPVPVDDLIPVLAAYREKQPNDPWLLYYEGYVAFDQERFADADKSFAAAEQLAAEQTKTTKKPPEGDAADESSDDDSLAGLIDLIRRQRCSARYELGEDVDVLVDYHHDEAAYQTLAGLAIQYRHWPVLKRLNRAYAAVKPNDSWLLYYEIRELLAAKNLIAVREKLQVMARRESQIPHLKYQREQLERELFAAENQDPIAAYLKSSDRSAAFSQLTQTLLANRDWTTLDKLCEQRLAGGKDPAVVLTWLEKAWRQSDDAKITELLIPWPTSTMAKQPYWESLWRERLVESLLRLNRWDEAHQQAQEARQRFDESWPLVMTYVARKDADAIAQALLDSESLAEGWTEKDFVTNSELRPILLDKAFEELRKQHQFAMPDYRTGESLVLLLRQPIELSESWLLKRLNGTDASQEPSLKISQISSSTFVIQWNGFRFAVMSATEPYFTPEFLNSPAFSNRELDGMSSLFDEQRACLRLVPLIADHPQPWNSPSTTVRELGARLLNEDVVGAVHRPMMSGHCDVAMLNDRQSELLARRLPFAQLDTKVMTLRSHQNVVRLAAEKRRPLEKLAGQTQTLEQSRPVIVEVQLCDPEIPMTAAFRVHKVRHHRFGGYELVVEYTGEEHFPGFPELRSGIQYVVPIDHVADVEFAQP